MREFDALRDYPAPKEQRQVAERTIHSRISASYRDQEFFDGARANGYGGLVNDGRWAPVARLMAAEYRLGSPSSVYGMLAPSSVLQVQCEKAFLLSEFARLGLLVKGTETSRYAIEHAEVPVDEAPPTALPYAAGSFDLVIATGAVYTLNLGGAIRCLREIMRVKRRHAFITLGAYETEAGYWRLRQWSLLGCTILRKDEWVEVMQHAGYDGDYTFVTAESLRLQ